MRAFVSVITLLALFGVAIGVMVLIVVLSVHAGFEQNLKRMLLGFSPHLTVSSVYQGGISQWQEMEVELGHMGEVKGASALVEGFVLLDVRGWNRPVQFRGINSENREQLAALEEMLNSGTVDLIPKAKSLAEIEREGASDQAAGEGGAVISKLLADQLMLNVGDQIRLLAAANLDAVMAAYRLQDQGRAYEVYATSFDPFSRMMEVIFRKEGDLEVADSQDVDAAYRLIQDLDEVEDGMELPPMRETEREKIGELREILDSFTKREGGKDFFESGTQEMIHAKLTELRELDLDQANLETMNEIRDFVLPKELKISGIYHDAQRARGPEVFVSLRNGQELRGLDPGVVEAIDIRIEDPYQADRIGKKLQKRLGDEWAVGNWMERHSQQFQLVKTEKIMMSFMLSFLTIISAFSITAVMYTMTLQKRQEIGVMKALGASPFQIIKIFVYQGLIVGIGGALLGVGLGLLALHYRQKIVDAIRVFGVDPFPPQFHGMNELPARIIPEYLIVIAVVSVILCLIAALIPALLAAFRDPAKSLRNLS